MLKTKDFNFIVSLLRGEKPNADGVDFYGVTGFCELNKISGYLYNRAKELDVKLPQGVERKLSHTLRLQCARNAAMREVIQQLSDALNDTHINYAFLKGSVLSNADFLKHSASLYRTAEKSANAVEGYTDVNVNGFNEGCGDGGGRNVKCAGNGQNANVGDDGQNANVGDDGLSVKWQCGGAQYFYGSGERVSNDIDILIQPYDITAITKLLKDMGFVQGYYDFKSNTVVELPRSEIISRRMNRGETAPFLLQRDNDAILPFAEIDVNFSLDYLPNSNPELLREMLSGTVVYGGGIKGGIRSFDAEKFFLHLISHQYKESVLYSMAVRNKDLEMYKLLDIYLFVKRGIVNIERAINLIFSYGLQREAYCVLDSVSKIFCREELKETIQRLRPKDAACVSQVTDPENKKTYVWTQPLKKRVLCYEKARMLREKKR